MKNSTDPTITNSFENITLVTSSINENRTYPFCLVALNFPVGNNFLVSPIFNNLDKKIISVATLSEPTPISQNPTKGIEYFV